MSYISKSSYPKFKVRRLNPPVNDGLLVNFREDGFINVPTLGQAQYKGVRGGGQGGVTGRHSQVAPHQLPLRHGTLSRQLT